MNSHQLFFEDPLLSIKIGEMLNETEIDVIDAVISVMGGEYAIMMMEKAKCLTESEGIEKKSGGKRTPGWAFFYLVRENTSKEEAKKIFKMQATERKRRYRARKKILMMMKKLELAS